MADAKATAEVVTRPAMRFVPIKEVTQQDLQAFYRIRERLVKACTALIHERRGWLSEPRIVLSKGIAWVRQALLSRLEHEQPKLSELNRNVFRQLHEEGYPWSRVSRMITSNWRRSVRPILSAHVS
jgi:transposase